MADYDWIPGKTGSWYDPGNWQGGTAPSPVNDPPTDSVEIDSGTAQIGAGDSAFASAIELAGVATAGAIARISIVGGSLSTDTMTIGDAGAGELYLGHDGNVYGNAYASGDVYVAAQAGSSGTITADGGAVLADGYLHTSSLNVNGTLYLGGTNDTAGGTATLRAINSGQVYTIGLTMYADSEISVDAAAYSGVGVFGGHNRYLFANAVTVDEGATLTGAGRIDANLSNDGTVIVSGGALQVAAGYSVSGGLHSGLIDVTAGSTFFASQISSQLVALNGIGARLALDGNPDNSDFTLDNLGVGTSVQLFGTQVTGAYEVTGGSLVLDATDGTHVIGLSYADPDAMLAVSYNAANNISTVSLTGFVWNNPANEAGEPTAGDAGDWADGGNWNMTGGDAAGRSPGADDLAVVAQGTAVVSSNDTVSSLWLEGSDGGGLAITRDGALSASHGVFLKTDGLSTLNIQGALYAQTLSTGGSGSSDIYVDFYAADGATLDVGTLDLGSNSALYDCGDGSVNAASLTLEGGRVHLGGGFAAGTAQMVIGTANSVGDNISVGADGTITGYGDLEAGVVNDGLVEARGGSLRVLADGTEPLAGTGTWQIDDHASLELHTPLARTASIVFAGSSATLALVGNATAAASPTLSGLAATDSIEIANGSVVSSAVADASGLHIITSGGEIDIALAEDHSADRFSVTELGYVLGSGFDTYKILDEGPSCFLTGTVIDTPDGPRAVETLRPGDLVLAGPDRTPHTIGWCGATAIELAVHPDPGLVAPVEITAGALAEGVPGRAVRLSGDHALWVGERWVRVRHLVNGGSIRPAALEATTIEYWHVELAGDAGLLWSAGMPCESYHPGAGRGHGGFQRSFGVPAEPREAPAHEGSPEVLQAMWQTLHARSVALGHPPFTAPATAAEAPRLLYDGIEIPGRRLSAKLLCFDLPLASGPALLQVPVRRPADAEPWSNDRRVLGVAIERIVTLTQTGAAELPIAGLSPRDGWWPAEDGARARWTAGRALLAEPPHGGVLQFHLA